MFAGTLWDGAWCGGDEVGAPSIQFVVGVGGVGTGVVGVSVVVAFII